MWRRLIVVWLISAIILSFIVILVEIAPRVEAPTTIYVDEDYITEDATHKKTVQAAIDNASIGDTVFVFNGTYYENVIVNKAINLTGINRENTTIDGSGVDDVIRVTADWVTIANFTVTGSGNFWGDSGIELGDVRNCRVTNNLAISNGIGIFVYWQSQDNIVDGNTVTSNDQHGIQVLSNSINNIIMNNNVSSSFWYGIDVSGSSNNIFWGNQLSNDGFFLEGTLLSHYNSQTITTNNTVNGESVYYYTDASGMDIDGTAMGQLLLVNCVDFKLRNLSINKTDDGIEIVYSTNISITGCNISSNNDNGVYLESSSNNNITGNNFTNNGGDGIQLWAPSPNNNIIGNNMTGNWIGVWLASSSNVVSGNNISGNQYGVFHYSSSCNSNIVKNNEIMSNFEGIHLSQSSHDDWIMNNNVSYNGWGITCWMASSHNIINNNVSYNFNGFGIQPSGTNNRIYHNNIFGNTVFPAQDQTNMGNEWDNGYPSGGNYWSKYTGEDKFKGPNQDIPGSDGIGDTPFIIDADSRDNYPLMQPYKPLENITVLKQGWNLISIPLIQEEQNLTRALGSIDSFYDAVRWYDGSDTNDPWKHLKIGKSFGNDLYELNETMGIWVHITRPGNTTFLYNGTTPTTSQKIQLYKGWNLVGYPSLTSYNRTDGLNNTEFGTHINKIMWYNASSQTWHTMEETDYFRRCTGYWIHAREDIVWHVPL